MSQKNEHATPALRLKFARIDAKHASPRAAARARGWNENTYKAHESGRNNFNENDAKRYGRAFKFNWIWLLHNVGEPKGKPTADDFEDDTDSADDRSLHSNLVPIREIDVSAGAGGGGEAMVSYQRQRDGSYMPTDMVRAEALFPLAWIHSLGLDPLFTDLVKVRGDSMSPEIEDSDWVFVDRRVFKLQVDDIYLLWDGVGVVAKSLQIIRGSKPLRVRIISANPKYPIDEVPIDAIKIIGRIHVRIGRIVRRS